MNKPSAKVYTCAICRKKSAWKKGWRRWTSVLMDESIPDNVPNICSDECQRKFELKKKHGEIQVPTVKSRGYRIRIVGKRVGY